MIREQLVKAHPARDGDFRWRGDGVSRIEGLSDAVFGFALTLLVVSLEVPTTFDSLAAMMLGLPAFAITFTLLILIWFAHYRFFRRYGLEDSRTIVLNVVLLFVVLFYIYPLKFLFQTILGMTMGLVGWKLDIAWLAPIGKSSLAAIRPAQWPAMMCIYAFGWSLLYGVFALMHAHALSRRVDLGLDPMEVLITRYTIYEHLVMIAAGLLSAVVVLGLAYGLGVSTVVSGILAGWTYAAIGPMQAVLGRRLAREKRALRADAVAPTDPVAVAVAGV